MNLTTYIKKYGQKHCSELWGIPFNVVGAYKRSYRAPRPGKAKKMADATNGELTLAGIYEIPVNNLPRRKKG